MNDEEIFNDAIQLPGKQEREAFVRQACGDDGELLASVLGLLESFDESEQFLEQPVLFGQEETVCYSSHESMSSAETGEFIAPGNLGHYEFIELLGKGGAGVVYRAHDPKLNRNVAIKKLSAETASSETAGERFLREAHAAAAVSHPNVITIHAVDEQDGVPYLVMECIEGKSLRDKIKQEGPLPLEVILRIGSQAAHGLAAAHQQGLIHRDVKPGNIMLENGVERVKITDFGLARAADDAHLTVEGLAVGTPQYMSPEQAKALPVDQRTDLFSLGVVLYEMCSGQAPFTADSSMAILRRICEEEPEAIRELNDEIPDWLEAAILRLLEKEPDHRIQTAQEVADILQAGLAHVQSPAAHPMRALESIRKPGTQPTQFNKTARRSLLLVVLAAAVAVISMIPFLVPETGEKANSDQQAKVAPPDRQGTGSNPDQTNQNEASPAIAPRTKGDGYAILFDGKDDYIAIPSLQYDYTEPFTLEVICRPDQEKQEQSVNIDPIFLSAQSELSIRNGQWLSFNFDRRHRSWWTGLGYRKEDVVYQMMIDERYVVNSEEERNIYRGSQHLALQWDGDEFRLYREGQIVSRLERTIIPSGPSGDGFSSPIPSLPTSLGRSFTPEANDYRFFSGVMECFRFSSVARYGEQYQPQGMFDSDDDTLALYRFSGQRDDQVEDLSGNEHHGQMVGATRVRVDDRLDVIIDTASTSRINAEASLVKIAP